MGPSQSADVRIAMHRAARTEDAVRAVLNRALTRRGWRPRVLPYAGYGSHGWVRLLARVLLAPPGSRSRDLEDGRGWRRFFSASAARVPVTVEVGGGRYQVVSGRDGHLDEVLPAALPPGMASAVLTVEGAAPVAAPLYVVGPQAGTGLVSDIDDTVMVTALPRPLVAFRNTFLRREGSREPVPGMAALYRELLAEYPGGLVVYLSTGAWNVASALEDFLSRNGYPPGPLLLTDWGPTEQGWFRSGREHKTTQLRRLLEELPQLTWILIGDDGQHDPALYAAAAAAFPGRVRALVIRELTAVEQVLTHGSTEPPSGDTAPGPTAARPGVEDVRAPDGVSLSAELHRRGLLGSGSGPA